MLKLNELDPKLRERIAKQIRQEDAALGPVETHSAKCAPVGALVGSRPKLKGGKASMVISLTAFRRRLLDPDAVAYACKPLTDAIASSLGVDDADPIVSWQYFQQQTKGREGVLVMIEQL